MKRQKVALTQELIIEISRLADAGGTYDSIAEELAVSKVLLRRWEASNWSVFQALQPAYKQAHRSKKPRLSGFSSRWPL